ncbi:uncharacterized protein [Ptychodera flava]|uniref:uncharacterized protein n=1 Tax=Ptychodera flava TaxID=63121 RepID=UPI00396A5C22
MRYTLLVALLAVSFFLLACIEAQDVTIDSYAITNPSDPAQISYNRATDTTITFTVTVNSGSSGGDIDGIDVAFYDISDTKIAGTEQAAGGTAPTSGNPTTIAASQTGFAMNGNTVTIKFSNEDDCTAVDYLCAQIKGTGVVTNSARHTALVSGDLLVRPEQRLQ